MFGAFGINRKIGGSSSPKVEIFSVLKIWHVHKNIWSCVENECCCPRTVNIPNVNFTFRIYPLSSMGWNYLSSPKLWRLRRQMYGEVIPFHILLVIWSYYHLSMLGLKLIHVSKMGPVAYYVRNHGLTLSHLISRCYLPKSLKMT